MNEYFFGNSLTGQLARTKDWSAHSLGGPQFWSTELKVVLGLMFNNPHPMCIFWGPDHIYFYNDAYIPIVGQSKHPGAMGKRGKEVWSEIWEILLPQINQVFIEGNATWNEDQFLPILGNDGNPREAYFTYSYSPAFLSTGKVAGVVVTCTETTEKIKAEKDLKTTADEVTEILEGMSDAFFTVDENWIVKRVNLQFEKIIQMPRENVIGKSLIDLYFSSPEQKESKYVQVYTRVMNDRVPETFIDHYAPFNIWTAVSAFPKSDGGIAVFFKEISDERKKAEDLKNAVISRDEFLSLASHELNTPLTSLKLQNQMLSRVIDKADNEPLSTDKIYKFSLETEKQVLRLNRLIDDMLDVSRIRTGNLTIEAEEFDLCQLARDVLNSMESQFATAKYKIPELCTCETAVGRWDQMRIEQVLINLLTNAIRYGDGKRIIIKVESDNKFAILSVKDEGIGIPAKDMEKIFERFERGRDLKNISGLGLGLYLSKQIVDAHSGNISVQSELGKGTTFTVKLPLNPAVSST